MSDPASSRPLPRTGDIIDGKYSLEELLGKGGMGAVYAARHMKLGHRVAIKLMFADAGSHEAAQRFINEGRAIANIQNDHVVRVFDVDEEHGYAYMVLELLSGEDLGHVLQREERLPYQLAVNYVLQALDGVKQAHAQGIVHRDLKPTNLFLAKRQDGNLVVKVLDFGISKANSASALGQSPSALTSTKAMLGSPLYMSPEQLRSSKNVDARADIWAIGIILYELITGKLPFNGENLGELFAAILETDAAPLRSRVPEVPANLDAIVGRCLQRRPEHRFQTAAELELALAPYSGTLVMGSSPYAFSAVASQGPMTSPMSGGPMTSPSAPMTGMTASAPMTAPAITADGIPRPPVAMRTVPLGAITPQPQQHQQSQAGLHAQAQRQTGNTWQNTGSTAKKSNVAVIAALASLALIGVAGIGFYGVSTWRHHDTSNGGMPSATADATASASAPVASSSAPPPHASAAEQASAAVAPTAPPTVTTKETASAPPTTPTTTTIAGNSPRRPPFVPPPTTKTEKVEPPRPPTPEPPKTVTPPRPPPPTTPTQAPTGGTLQPNR